MSYGRAMSWLAEREPDADAILFDAGQQAQVRSRGELERRSNRLARDYRARGVGEGDLVTVALGNGIEYFEACLAVWKLAATPNPISYRLPERERQAIVELANPALVVGVESRDYGEVPSLPVGHEPEASLSDEPLDDVVSVVLALEPGDGTVVLRALKDHDNPDLSALHVALDPRTLLLVRN